MDGAFFFIAVSLFLTGGALFLLLFLSKMPYFNMALRDFKERSSQFAKRVRGRPEVSLVLDLEGFQRNGMAISVVILVQCLVAVTAVFFSSLLRNPWFLIPFFLFGREVFALISFFISRQRKLKENSGLQTLLRTYLALYNQSKNRRDCLGQLEKQLPGVWKVAVGKLYRHLTQGGDRMQHYDAFAAMFAGNPHVRLLARILYHSDLYGGDPRDSIDRILQDVMRDRLDDEQNQSETAASMTIALLLNLGIIAIATHNLLMPSLAAVLIETTEGRLLLALAVLLCMFSIRLTRKIISS